MTNTDNWLDEAIEALEIAILMKPIEYGERLQAGKEALAMMESDLLKMRKALTKLKAVREKIPEGLGYDADDRNITRNGTLNIIIRAAALLAAGTKGKDDE